MSHSFLKRMLAVVSLCTAALLVAGPVAVFADDDHRPAQSHDEHDKDHNNDRDDRAPTSAVRVTELVEALNNQVALLNAQPVSGEEEEDETEALAQPTVTTVSLATLEAGLSSTEVGMIATAVTNTTKPLHDFLNGGSAVANAILSALKAANIDPASVLAILPMDDRLIVLTA